MGELVSSHVEAVPASAQGDPVYWNHFKTLILVLVGPDHDPVSFSVEPFFFSDPIENRQ